MENRAGFFIKQPSGYSSFKPKPLPPENPSVHFDAEMMALMSTAERLLGRLDGVTQTLPNPALFVAMYVQKEAVLSSQIEGTQASLSDVLGEISEKREDISEVSQYVAAMNYGLRRLKDLPLSLRLLREIHSVLLKQGRGSERNPGEFRTSQNWIGPQGCTLMNATFVPPAVPDMREALGDLELFINSDTLNDLPLVKIALVHAQFESIHPFLDGNGRMGRLLITFWLCQQQILSQPLLYLSYYFKKNRLSYYENLMKVRKEGDWETWVKFFLTGVAEVSDEATQTAKDILALKEDCEKIIAFRSNLNDQKFLDALFERPIISKREVAELLGVTDVTAGRIVDDFCKLNILEDATPGKQRYKKFAFSKYIDLLNRGTEI